LERPAALAARQRTAGQEREFLTLTWAADYADHALGLKAASGMAAASLPVHYQLSKVINEELKAESPRALAAACQALTVPVLLLQGGQDPRPAAACDSLARGTTSGDPDHAAPSRPSPLDRSTRTGQRDPARLPHPPK
jgi:proline iminopeptidase